MSNGPLLVAPTGIVLRESTDVLASTHPKVGKAISFMRGHGHERINVSDIAQHVGMSREGLRKAFVAHLHRAPGTVLRELRLKLAKNMLATTDLTLEAIALDSGFRDATRLCAVFRREVGSTPAQFRRKAQE
jgi:LacI family transcriptional regulator